MSAEGAKSACLVVCEARNSCCASTEYGVKRRSHDRARKIYATGIGIGQDSNGNVYYPPLIYVADETLTSIMSIITLTSMLTHEMIHQYVDENGNGLQKQYDADYKGIPYDPHKGEFTKWMDIANSKHGLNVVEIGSRAIYDSSSVDRLKAFAGKDYDVNESDDFSKMQYGVRRIHHENGYIEQRYS